MGKTRITIAVCDNPDCKEQRIHSAAAPAQGFHLNSARYNLPDGSWLIGKLFACTADCLAKAIDAAAKKAVLAAPSGEKA